MLLTTFQIDDPDEHLDKALAKPLGDAQHRAHVKAGSLSVGVCGYWWKVKVIMAGRFETLDGDRLGAWPAVITMCCLTGPMHMEEACRASAGAVLRLDWIRKRAPANCDVAEDKMMHCHDEELRAVSVGAN